MLLPTGRFLAPGHVRQGGKDNVKSNAEAVARRGLPGGLISHVKGVGFLELLRILKGISRDFQRLFLFLFLFKGCYRDFQDFLKVF